MKYREQRIKICIAWVVLGMVLSALFSTTALAASVNSGMRVAAGDNHTVLIDAQGNIWAFGDNSSGQLGDGTTESKDTPVMVYSGESSIKAVSVAAGSNHSLALLEDGTVLMWGYGNASQRTAIQSKAVAIAAGADMCMAILDSGAAVCWNSGSGALPIKKENGSVLQNVNGIAAGSNNFLAVIAGPDGSVYQLQPSSGRDYWTALKVLVDSGSGQTSSDSTSSGGSGTTPLKDAVSIAAGTNFGVALLNTGEVYTWGTNSEYGVLGQGTFDVEGEMPAKKVDGLPAISKISAGTGHVIVVGSSGAVFGWGAAGGKRLDAVKDSPGYSKPESLAISGISQFDCGSLSNIMLNNSGDFYIWGNGRAIEKLTLTHTLLKTPTPTVTASLVGDKTMTITWNPAEFRTEFGTGFVVSYVAPDGTTGKTMLLPLTTPRITLRGLQPATNYKITLSIFGKTGAFESAPAFIVQTAAATESSSDSGSVVPSVSEQINSAGTESKDSSGSGENDPSTGGLYSLFNLIMTIVIILVLSLATFAFFYFRKRNEKEKLKRVKPVRVSPDEGADSTDLTENPDLAKGVSEDEDIDMIIVPEKNPDSLETTAMTEEQPVLPEADRSPETAESYPDASSGNPETQDHTVTEPEETMKSPTDKDNDDFIIDNDDFIIRKPGEPKN